MDELRKNGIGLAVISYDSPQILADFSKRQGITYPLLSDVGSATIRRYGILNTVIEEALGPNGKDPAVLADLQRYVTVTQASERFRGIPFPGTFMLDRQGRVTARFFEDYYWERHTVSSIMLRVGGAKTLVEAIQASTEHLDVKAYPSDPSASLGTRFSLAVEVTPKREHARLCSWCDRLPCHHAEYQTAATCANDASPVSGFRGLLLQAAE